TTHLLFSLVTVGPSAQYEVSVMGAEAAEYGPDARNLKQENRNITLGDIFSISLPKLSFMKAIALTLTPGERLVSWLGGISKVKRTIHSDFDILSIGDNGISKA